MPRRLKSRKKSAKSTDLKKKKYRKLPVKQGNKKHARAKKSPVTRKRIIKKKSSIKKKRTVKHSVQSKKKVKTSLKKKPTLKKKATRKKKPAPKKKVKVTRKKKALPKKKPEPKKKKKCNYNKIFETTVHGITGHYNVIGVGNLSIECLASLLQNQIQRTAQMFRFWYQVPKSPEYEQGIASTSILHKSVLEKLPGGKPRPGGISHFLNRLPGPVIYYWFRTEGYKSLRIDLHGRLIDK